MRLFPCPVEYRRLNTVPVKMTNGILHIPQQAFTDFAFEAFRDVSHLLRSSHLAQIRSVFDDSASYPNERFAALEFLKNANIASGMILPLCQDTGTAAIIGEKGHLVSTNGAEEQSLSEGIRRAYSSLNLRYSQNIPSGMYSEKNSNNNLPAQIDLAAVQGNEYKFLCIAKGGGSANKTFLFQENRALLDKEALLPFLEQKIKEIGVSACPPYHLAVVIGGLSAEMTLKTVKLASAHALDHMPGSEQGFRDIETENILLEAVNRNGLGAQFGGRHFCLDVRVIRLPRHGASLPVGIGVSCVADRNILGKMTPNGVFLEQLETNPARFFPDIRENVLPSNETSVDLNRPLAETLADLKCLPVGSRLSLNGTMVVARDMAHARFKDMLKEGKKLPEYLKRYPVYYAGPAKKPDGYVSGSFGPTTAGRMDGYTDMLQSEGASLIMLAKGNRSRTVLDSCRKHGGFYLGTLGGAAAQTAFSYITSCECIDFPELGMEAVWKITVKDFPAFLLIDDKGHDFYRTL